MTDDTYIVSTAQKRKRPEKPAVQVDDSEIKGKDAWIISYASLNTDMFACE